MKRTRNLKVGSRYRNTSYKTVFFPEIRITGCWLEEDCGISIGDQVSIDISPHSITIKKQSQ